MECGWPPEMGWRDRCKQRLVRKRGFPVASHHASLSRSSYHAGMCQALRVQQSSFMPMEQNVNCRGLLGTRK